MKLETASSRAISEVSVPQLREMFEHDARRGEFIILSQAPETYLQASGEGDGPYALEHREGRAEAHFSATGEIHKADVLRAFLSYLAGDGRWRTEFSWEKMSV
jgi:hypothetical protein